jgi:hypothetical protein
MALYGRHARCDGELGLAAELCRAVGDYRLRRSRSIRLYGFRSTPCRVVLREKKHVKFQGALNFQFRGLLGGQFFDRIFVAFFEEWVLMEKATHEVNRKWKPTQY